MPIYAQFWRDGAPAHAEIEGETAFFIDDLFSNPTRTGVSVALSDAEILPPVFPSKLIAIGLNYADHAAEHGNEVPPQPLMWLKAPSSLLGARRHHRSRLSRSSHRPRSRTRRRHRQARQSDSRGRRAGLRFGLHGRAGRFGSGNSARRIASGRAPNHWIPTRRSAPLFIPTPIRPI